VNVLAIARGRRDNAPFRVVRLLHRSICGILLKDNSVKLTLTLAALAAVLCGNAAASESIRLANNPALSPDGATLAFDWNGDVWSVQTAGGVARPLTRHPARDRQPRFSADGKEIAFISERSGSPQVYVMPAAGGTPRQVTFHTAGFTLQEWTPDGRLLVGAARDNFWRHAERFLLVNPSVRKAEEPLFDDYGQNGSLSPDGRQLLFTREGPAWWRKGYHGSQASQIWLYDLVSKSFQKLLGEETGCLWPLWKPDGEGFYYVGASSGSCNLWEHDLQNGQGRQLTRFTDDSVVFPCISRDGSTIAFRHLFDLYRFRPATGEAPVKIDVNLDSDLSTERVERRILRQATDVAFTTDGLEIAMIAGGDLWVMDTELKEPVAVTATAEEERSPVFAPNGQALLFIADRDAGSDVYRAIRTEPAKPWWQNSNFKVDRLTKDGETKVGLRFSPDGAKISYIRARGDLWVADADGSNARKLVPSSDRLEYDWSPDGRWIVYAKDDADFNRDVWLIPIDGSRPAFNLSRHPYNDTEPVWSPDGRLIAFTGRRGLNDVDIHYVWLRAEDDEKSGRDRSMEKSLEKIGKARAAAARRPSVRDEDDGKTPGDGSRKPAGPVAIDFDKIHERIHRITIPDSVESGLFWSPDSKKLAFAATVDGRHATYTVDIPDDLKPKLISTQLGSHARWLKQGNQIVWLSNGVPASFTPQSEPNPTGGSAEPPSGGRAPVRRARGGATAAPPSGDEPAPGYRFQALQRVDLRQRNRAAFDLCWRTMRDHWYDEHLGNRDWDSVRRKYLDAAEQAPDVEAFATVVQLMLGELNGSHLGFLLPAAPGAAQMRARPGDDAAWSEETAHLGIRFRADAKGPGLTIRDVLTGGPAEHKRSRLAPDEVVLRIDDTAVTPETDLTTVLNGPLARDVHLHVRGVDGKERGVTLRPISYTRARELLYEAWLDGNRKAVEKASNGTLGYLHISAMLPPSFLKFEEELYAVGAGKEGLVIDVRENGGGSTADHLLTALTQPVHAITVPRGGEPGYPQDRKIYATWNKPIVVLCNQNSFSNAEIFSHAIKTLKRGPLVGVTTAGGVVSTGAVPIMDLGTLRLPFRGWYLVGDGEDMELNGAVPDHLVWPQPGDLPQGKDAQLAKGVEVLLAEVKEWKSRPRPNLRKATERVERAGPAKSAP
jgi:tricorn protease